MTQADFPACPEKNCPATVSDPAKKQKNPADCRLKFCVKILDEIPLENHAKKNPLEKPTKNQLRIPKK